jgi:hypothetical protein
MNPTPGQLIRHTRSGEVYTFLGYGMSHCAGEWVQAAFYRRGLELFSQPVERFEQRFEEVK